MPKQKRYRLKIPEDIQKELEVLKWAWHYENGKIIDENMSISISKPFTEWKSRFSDLPKSWLKEIKDEPLSDKESFASDYGRLPDKFPKEYYNYYKQGFKKGEESQKLRHQETTTVKDSLKKI